MTAICEKLPKAFDIFVMVVFPEEMAHVSLAYREILRPLPVHLAVTSWDTAFLKVLRSAGRFLKREGEERGCGAKLDQTRGSVALTGRRGGMGRVERTIVESKRRLIELV